MQHVGRQEELGIGIESVNGTPITTPQRWVKHVTSDVISRVEKAVDDNVRGVLEDSEGARKVREWFDGDLGGIAHVDVLGYILANIYGTINTSSLGNNVYSHVFSLEQDVQHQSLTIFRKDADAAQQKYGGGVINTFELNATTDDYVRFTANIICANEASDASTPTYNTEYDFVSRDITVKMADTEGGLATAPALPLKTVDVRFDTGAISDFIVGSYNPSNYNAKMAIEVEFTKNFVDETFEDLFKANTYKYMQITIEGETTIGSGGSNKPKVVVLLNRVQVMDWSRSGGSDELVEETVTLKAFYNQTDSEQSTTTLQNLTASYAAGS
jgi:hypothetical protein